VRQTEATYERLKGCSLPESYIAFNSLSKKQSSSMVLAALPIDKSIVL
jgi:hypothetical protein